MFGISPRLERQARIGDDSDFVLAFFHEGPEIAFRHFLLCHYPDEFVGIESVRLETTIELLVLVVSVELFVGVDPVRQRVPGQIEFQEQISFA